MGLTSTYLKHDISQRSAWAQAWPTGQQMGDEISNGPANEAIFPTGQARKTKEKLIFEQPGWNREKRSLIILHVNP